MLFRSSSFLYNRPVGALIRGAAANTAMLAVVALALATVLGIPLGIVTGSRRSSAAAIVRGLSLVCLSIPPLLMSLLLVFIATRTRWFPAGGMTSVNAVDLSWSAWMLDVARHLPMPAFALALPLAATFERLQSQSMAETVSHPFVLAAIARGVPPSEGIYRHAWPASVRPICEIGRAHV